MAVGIGNKANPASPRTAPLACASRYQQQPPDQAIYDPRCRGQPGLCRVSVRSWQVFTGGLLQSG
jgi:hypothetical protein